MTQVTIIFKLSFHEKILIIKRIPKSYCLFSTFPEDRSKNILKGVHFFFSVLGKSIDLHQIFVMDHYCYHYCH